MTLSEIATLCPAPEGMEWCSMPDGSFIAAGDVSRIRIRPSPGWGWKINTENCGVTFGCEAHTDADLPSAYLRALTAVGLASDADKEALRAEVSELRRRLTWSEKVPTEGGLYLVDETFPGPKGRNLHDLRMMEMHDNEWATIGGSDEFEPR